MSLSAFLTFIITGLAVGALYGLTATGLVLTYKTSGVFNFAHGATGAAGAYLYYELNQLDGVPEPIALLICLFVAAPLAGLLLERLARRLAGANTANKVVATVGLALAIQGLLSYQYGPTALAFPEVLPRDTVKIFNVHVGYDQMIGFALALAVAIALYVFFRVAPLGIQMRAVVDDPDLLGLSGTSAVRVRGTAWVMGSVFATISGILLAPTIGLDSTLLTLVVLQAFGAAAIGAFSSLPLCYVGGLGVGIATQLTQAYEPDVAHFFGLGETLLQNLPSAVPFLTLFVVLLVVPARKLVESGKTRPQAPPRQLLPERARLGVLGAVGVIALFLPELVGARLPVYSDALCFVVIFASLNMLVRTSGQVSLCQAGFVGVGAASFSHFATDLHFPWLVAVLVAGLVTVPVGALVALPAIRLSGLYLALATFGFGVLLQQLYYSQSFAFGMTGSLTAPRPFGLKDDRSFYYVLLAMAVAAGVVVGLVNRSRLGRLLRGMSDSPSALSTLGLGVNVTRVLVFCLASFLAGVGGALLAARGQSTNSIPFYSFNSLVWLAVLAISGRGRQGAAIIAAIVLEVLPAYTTDPKLGQLFTPSFGILALLAALVASRARRAEAAGEAGPSVAATPTGTRDRISLRLAPEPGPVRARVLALTGAGR